MYACFGCAKRFESKLKACGKCKRAFYCSGACQRAHWHDHKPLCDPTLGKIKQDKYAEMMTIVDYIEADIDAAEIGPKRKEIARRLLRDFKKAVSDEVLELAAHEKGPTVKLDTMADILPMLARVYRILKDYDRANEFDQRARGCRMGVVEGGQEGVDWFTV